MINVDAYGIMTLLLGRVGENNVTRIEFDYTPWAEEFGDGTLSLLHERAGDTEPYPVIITTENNVGTWLISNIDTAKFGIGKAQLIYIVDDQIKKSRVYNTTVAQSLTESSETPPDPYESWIEQILEARTTVLDTKTDIEQLAQDIESRATEIDETIDTGKSEITSTITSGKTELTNSTTVGKSEISALITDGKAELYDIISSVQATDVNNDGNIVITI